MKLLAFSLLLLLSILGLEAASLADPSTNDFDHAEPYIGDIDLDLDFFRKAPIGRRSIKTFSNSQLRGKKVFVIGDIHGCYHELIGLLRKMNVLVDPRRPERGIKRDAIVIIAGDLVNRGPHSEKVMDYVMKINNLYTVRGNHEQYYVNRGTNKYSRWINRLPYVISLPKYNSYVVHAGMLPKVSVASQTKFTVTQMRNVIRKNGKLEPIRQMRPGTHWAKLWSKDSRKMIYFGHDGWRTRNGPQIFRSATGIDTRCAKGGKLTAVELPVKKRFITYKCSKGCRR